MSKNVTIAGTNYNNVPSVEIPLQTSGTASFYDVSDTTAVAGDVASGKYFYASDGTLTLGTATGGGGSGAVTQDANGYVVLDDEEGAQITVEPLSVTQNGTYTAPTNTAYSPVTVNVSGGGGLDEDADVIFIDYDGTLLYTYSKTDFANLAEMPANPSHTGLTAQGWNWTLANAKTQVTSTGYIVIGQSYITDDGKTRLYITIQEDDLTRPATKIKFGMTSGSSVTLDWGDGTVETKTTTTATEYSHDYLAVGDYVITLHATTGKINFSGSIMSNTSYSNTNRLRKAEIGTINTTNIDQFFRSCARLETVTLPTGITNTGTYAFSACRCLKGLVIPSTVTSFGRDTCSDCYSVTAISIPNNASGGSINNIFARCYALKHISLPDSLNTLSDYAFSEDISLKRIPLPKNGSIGSSVYYQANLRIDELDISTLTSMGSNAFQYWRYLKKVKVACNIGNGAFRYCSGLDTLTMTSGTTINSSWAFSGCSALKTVSLPNTLTTIGERAFHTATSLEKIIIPSTVVTISDRAFEGTTALKEIHLLSTNPPTLSGTYVFTSSSNDYIIYVPYSADHSVLTAYQTAQNWTTWASHIQEEPQ